MYQGFCNGLRPFSPPLNCKKYYLKKFKMSEYIIIIITIIIIKQCKIINKDIDIYAADLDKLNIIIQRFDLAFRIINNLLEIINLNTRATEMFRLTIDAYLNASKNRF